MSVFLANLADKVFSKLTPQLNKDSQNQKEHGRLLYHSNGSVSLNLENEDVQQKITQHLKELAHVKIDPPPLDRSVKTNKEI